MWTLVTRRLVWVDMETGEERPEKVSLSFAWNLFGVHSYKWWWVRRYGTLDCGCTQNPLTKRRVLTIHKCPIHMARFDDTEE
jgi:hypothetical protein